MSAKLAGLALAVGVAVAQSPPAAPAAADRAAWTLLLNLIKDAPPSAWSRALREQFLAKYGFNDGEASLMITEANIYGWKTGEASAEAVRLFAAIRRGQSGQKAEVVAARLESEQRRRIEAAIVQVQSHLRPEAEPRLTALLRHVKDEDGSSGTASRQSIIRGVC